MPSFDHGAASRATAWALIMVGNTVALVWTLLAFFDLVNHDVEAHHFVGILVLGFGVFAGGCLVVGAILDRRDERR